jgi:hypothetical protein
MDEKTAMGVQHGRIVALEQCIAELNIEGGHEGPHPSPNKKAKKRKFHTLDALT